MNRLDLLASMSCEPFKTDLLASVSCEPFLYITIVYVAVRANCIVLFNMTCRCEIFHDVSLVKQVCDDV